MLKIKDTKLFEKFLEDNEIITMTFRPVYGPITVFCRIREFKDSLGTCYYEYLQIDGDTKIITGRIDCPARDLVWETNQLELDHIPAEIINLVEEVSD